MLLHTCPDYVQSGFQHQEYKAGCWGRNGVVQRELKREIEKWERFFLLLVISCLESLYFSSWFINKSFFVAPLVDVDCAFHEQLNHVKILFLVCLWKCFLVRLYSVILILDLGLIGIHVRVLISKLGFFCNLFDLG